jgi:hypothetical protein
MPPMLVNGPVQAAGQKPAACTGVSPDVDSRVSGMASHGRKSVP